VTLQAATVDRQRWSGGAADCSKHGQQASSDRKRSVADRRQLCTAKWPVSGFWRTKHAEWRKDVPFRGGGLNDGQQHVGVSNFPKPVKIGREFALHSVSTARPWRLTSQKNDVIGALPRCQLIFDDHCQTYSNLLPNCCQKCQIIVPIHIDLNKLRTHFCVRFRP